MEDLYKTYNRQLYKIEIIPESINSQSLNLVKGDIPMSLKSDLDPAILGVGSFQGNLVMQGGNYQSPDFVTGSSGWQIKSDGSVEFNSGTFRGTLTAGTIYIPNSTSPLFSVDLTGNMIAKSYNLITQYTAGETIVANRLVCLKHQLASWGDDSSSEKNTTATFSQWQYVDHESPTTNFGATGKSLSLIGDRFYFTSGLTYYVLTYGQIDFTNNPPGLPDWNEIEGVYLRIYTVFAGGVHNPPVLSRVTSSWSEDTITYDTTPTDDGETWATARAYTSYLGEATDTTPIHLDSIGYFEFDITDLYRLWSAGKITNYGFVIKATIWDTASNKPSATIGGRTRTGGGNFNQAPYILFRPIKDNPGSITLTVNDGKIYHAAADDYTRIKNIIGIAKNDATSGQTVDVYSLVDKSIISMSTVNASNYYLTGTVSVGDEGAIRVLTNDIIENDKWNLKIGIGVSNGLSIDFDKNPVFIQQSVSRSIGLLPPPHARMAVIKTGSDESILFKDRVQTTPLGTWASGTSGLLTTSSGADIYWYK